MTIQVAAFGFDYSTSCPAPGITDDQRARLLRPPPVDKSTDPFTRSLHRTISGHALARPGTVSKGTSSS